jgi:hypothetical protein
MKRVLLTALPLVAVAGLVWAGQDMGGGGQEEKGHPMPKPSKEHEFLKEMEGTWDAEMTFAMPGAAEQSAKGTETVAMVGAFWAVFDVKFPEMMGMAWHGHGTLGYDPTKKKFVGSFVHSAAPNMSIGEGSMDAGGKSVTMAWEGVGPSGAQEKMREVFEKKDKDNAVMTMYGAGPDGKEMKHFTMTYKRKK